MAEWTLLCTVAEVGGARSSEAERARSWSGEAYRPGSPGWALCGLAAPGTVSRSGSGQ